jgi:putative tryptophan/tyrosine transport system substrate-binding protein
MSDMKRRKFITLLGGAAAAWPLAARTQQKLARIGFLRQAAPHEKQFEAFREGLRAAGYVEGQNIVIEQRYAAGAYDRLGDLAAELVRANVDVIVVDGTAAAKACKSATATIPIVFALAVDPVADGVAASFARPEGNLTGLTMAAGYALAGKRWSFSRTWWEAFRASRCSAILAIRCMFPTCVRRSGLRPRSVLPCVRSK